MKDGLEDILIAIGFLFILGTIDFALLDTYPLKLIGREILLEDFWIIYQSLSVYHLILFPTFYFLIYHFQRKILKFNLIKTVKILFYCAIIQFIFGFEDLSYFFWYIILGLKIPDNFYWLYITPYGFVLKSIFGKVDLLGIVITSIIGIVTVTFLELKEKEKVERFISNIYNAFSVNQPKSH